MPNRGSINQHGWGVYRIIPWHMHGIYFTEAEADAEAKNVGGEYNVSFGSSYGRSGNFTVVPAPGGG